MDAALYYTFSTIAQALAAAIALLGAFTLYRLQLLAAAMPEAASILKTHTTANRADVDAAFIVADYGKVFALVRAADAKSRTRTRCWSDSSSSSPRRSSWSRPRCSPAKACM